jgi:type III secretion system needle length determinant
MDTAKDTFNRLVDDIKERLKEYKPPIMKMQLQLKPMNLGNIDITVLSRGGNLHLQMSASSQVLQMFASHANDLKDALNNIGFNDVQMNFNSNGDDSQSGSQNQDNQQNNSSKGVSSFAKMRKGITDEDLDSDLALNGTQIATNEQNISSLEIILPQYA